MISASSEDYLIGRQLNSNFTPLDTVYLMEQTAESIVKIESAEPRI